jgi:two-component system sensor histidine kinase BaeS
MLRTLRWRLILSHVLPLLVIVPMMGLALVYVLETQVVLANLSNDLAVQARLIAELAGERPSIWADPAQAQAFIASKITHVASRVMLVGPAGQLLSSSDPADAVRSGQMIDVPNLAQALAGKVATQVSYSQAPDAEIVDVLAPVVGPDGRMIGVVRLTHRQADVTEQLIRLRTVIAGVLIVGLVLGASVGGALAVNLASPIRQVIQALQDLAERQQPTTLPERGPEELRRLERAFNTMVDRLAALERSQRQLLSNLVHELGQQLGPLVSALQALRAGADEDPTLRRELLMGVDAGLARVRRLLDDLVQLYDRVTGDLELDRRPVTLGEWLPALLTPWREAAQAGGLRWQAFLPADLPTMIIDPDRIGQALGNVLSNAVKYTPPGGAVTVAAGMNPHNLWLQVCDTGPGIATEDLDRIFIPFYRSRSAQRFADGMGLGLAIARDLVVAHGGRLEIESIPGQGSRFTLHLPLPPESRQTPISCFSDTPTTPITLP